MKYLCGVCNRLPRRIRRGRGGGTVPELRIQILTDVGEFEAIFDTSVVSEKISVFFKRKNRERKVSRRCPYLIYWFAFLYKLHIF
jgi:hypothetical protein